MKAVASSHACIASSCILVASSHVCIASSCVLVTSSHACVASCCMRCSSCLLFLCVCVCIHSYHSHTVCLLVLHSAHCGTGSLTVIEYGSKDGSLPSLLQ